MLATRSRLWRAFHVSKYRYILLRVMAYEAKDFPVDQMRKAVDYLRSIPDAMFLGLSAFAETVRAVTFVLGPQAFLKLGRRLGRTPSEVWAQFDAEIDRQLYEVLLRKRAGKPSSKTRNIYPVYGALAGSTHMTLNFTWTNSPGFYSGE